MKRKKEKLYSTGEFAKYFGITKDTLLYYDKIKLFSPAGIKENGYRYYTTSQIDLFGTLLSLREMNVPINEIREYFQNPSPKKLNEMATIQMEKIEMEIKRLQEIKGLFTNIMDIMKEVEDAVLGQVEIKELPPERFLYSKQNDCDSETSIQQWQDISGVFVQETNLKGTAFIGSILTEEDMKNGQFRRIDRLFVKSKNRSGKVRKGGSYAVFYYKGKIEELPEIYPYILEEIERLGYYLSGDAYEEYLITELSTKKEEEYVTKITIKVSSIRDKKA